MLKWNLMLICCLLLLCHEIEAHQWYGNAEKKLHHHLFHKQQSIKHIRPVNNASSPIVMQFGMSLSQIIGVDEKNEILSLSVWIRQKWMTDTLKWNPDDFDGIKMINIRADLVWVPDIVLYNSVDDQKVYGSTFDKLETRIRLNYDGENVWLAPIILKSKCKINIKDFPFDTQVCSLKFSSWTYGGEHLNLLAEENSLETGMYSGNSEWLLSNTSAVRNEVKYYCCPIPWPDVTFTLILKRRSLFYMVNLIMPMIAIGILALLSFTLPVESGERMTLSVTVLLALTVFMFFVAETIPATSDGVPLVGAFFTTMLIEMVLVIFLLCYVISVHHKTEQDPPMSLWMRYFVYEWLAYVIGMRFHASNRKTSIAEKRLFVSPLFFKFKNIYDHAYPSVCDQGNLGNTKDVASIKTPLRGRQNGETIRNEWQICAKTLDKMCSLLFFGTFLLTLLAFYLKTPAYVP